MFLYKQLDDPQQILPLATSAFALRPIEQGAADGWLASSVKHGCELYGVYEDDALLAGFMLYDFQMRLRSCVVPMGGIGLLCSRLDARGKGAVRFMIQNSLDTMMQKGQVVCVLDPFDETFYRHYGWEKFSRCQIIEISPNLLKVPERLGAGITATDLPFPDEASMSFYNQYAAEHYTLAQRTQREWESRTQILSWSTDTAARGVVKFFRNECVAGLMGYDLTRKDGEDRPTFHANLLACEDEAVFQEMLRYLRQLSHQVATLRICLPLDRELWPYLSDRPAKSTIRDLFMIRIVSLDLLDGLRMDAPDMSLGVDVVDEQAPWNHGVWDLTITSGVLRVQRGQRADLRCGIGALSSVVSGFSSFAQLIASRHIESLDTYQGQDLPKTVTFLADYF